eukprot:6483844-Amphidinium_carterae.1
MPHTQQVTTTTSNLSKVLVCKCLRRHIGTTRTSVPSSALQSVSFVGPGKGTQSPPELLDSLQVELSEIPRYMPSGQMHSEESVDPLATQHKAQRNQSKCDASEGPSKQDKAPACSSEPKSICKQCGKTAMNHPILVGSALSYTMCTLRTQLPCHKANCSTKDACADHI